MDNRLQFLNDLKILLEKYDAYIDELHKMECLTVCLPGENIDIPTFYGSIDAGSVEDLIFKLEQNGH